MPPRRTIEDRIAEHLAKIEKLKAQKNKKTHAQDTRRKVLIGAAVLSAIEKGGAEGLEASKLAAKLLPRFLTRDNDKELLSDILKA